MINRALRLGLLSLVVALFSYVQSRMLTHVAGAGATLDAYYLAMTLPMAVVAVVGLLTDALLVPAFVRELEEFGHVRAVAGAVAIGAVVVAVCVTVTAPMSVWLHFWPGTALGTDSSWLLFMSLGALAYGVSFVLRSLYIALQQPDVFVWSQVASGVAFVVPLALVPRGDIVWFGLLFLASGLAQLAVCTGAMFLRGLRPRIGFSGWPGDALVHVRTGLLASAVAVGILQVNVAVDRWFAAGLGAGVVTDYFIADKIVGMVMAIIATAIGMSVFPELASRRHHEANALASDAAVTLVFVLGPISAAMRVFSPQVIALLFGGGRFTPQAVAQTAGLLKILSLSLVPIGLVYVLPRRLQGVGAYWTHAALSVLLMTVNLGGKLLLIPFEGVAALASATVIAYFVAAGAYSAVLSHLGLWRLRRANVRDIVAVVASAFLAAAVLTPFQGIVTPLVGSIVAVACVAVLWLAAFALRVEPAVKVAKGFMRRRDDAER